MALAEKLIDELREGATAGEESQGREPLPSVFVAIELCLLFLFRRTQDETDGLHWRWHSESRMSARVYPNVEKDTITVAVFDDDGLRRTQAWHAAHPGDEKGPQANEATAIDEWSTDIRMTGNWRRRLRRAAGEALVLAQRRPRCPRCRTPLVLCERNDRSGQFFGCKRYPECSGSAGIADHDLERKKAGISFKRVGQ